MADIVLLGPPGSGKGTQAQLLLDSQPNLAHLSTGNILREAVKSSTKLGLEVKSLLDKGQLVSDELVNSLVFEWVNNHASKDILFDGFPRTGTQALAFHDFMQANNRAYKVIELDVPESELLDRIRKRCTCASCGYVDKVSDLKESKNNWVCPSCGSQEIVVRSDDREDIVKDRFLVYNSEVRSLREHLCGSFGGCFRINGVQEASKVYQDILDALEQVK